jgi:type I restriction enzyme S subunit
MTSKLKPYPKYKDSGIQWIGEIPEGWEVRKISSFGFFSSSGIDKKTEPDESLVKMVNYTDIYGNDFLVIDSKRELMTVSCPKEKITFCNLKKGDIVFTPSSETEEDIGLSAVILENLKNTVFSYHVIRFRPIIKINLLYKKYIGNNHFVLSQFSRTCKGTTRQILTHNDFKGILIVLPPIEDQTAIANFLDKKTAKIDVLIEKDKKLIELLKEKRTALINHVVTKGLDPNVKLKDSGVEWIGEIPEGWKVKKLKTISKIVLGKMLTNEDKGNYLLKPYLRAQNIFWENVDVSDIKEMWFSPTEIKIYRLSKNDLLVSEGGEVGRTAIWSEEIDECYIQNSVHKVTILPEHNPRYLLYVFETFGLLGYFESIVNRVSIGHLTREKLKEVNCIVPPLSDQTAISNFLDKNTAKIDKTIKLIEQKVNLLQEYKKSLIHYVVTGKVDVRKSDV